jgi:hypothetical protein
MTGIYLNNFGGNSNFHSIILKKHIDKDTYIMALGYSGGGIYEEFFGKFSSEGDKLELGKFSNSIGPYDWEKRVKISYEAWEEKVEVSEFWTKLDDSESRVRDNMFFELEKFIYYGEEAEKLESDVPILKDDFDFYLNYESNANDTLKNFDIKTGIYVNDDWEVDGMNITQHTDVWYLSIRFNEEDFLR